MDVDTGHVIQKHGKLRKYIGSREGVVSDVLLNSNYIFVEAIKICLPHNLRNQEKSKNSERRFYWRFKRIDA